MREKINFDAGWKFFLGDLSPRTDVEGWGGAKGKAFNFGATALDFDDAGWRSLSIPHDFVLEGDYTRKFETFKEGNDIPAMETMNSRHFVSGSLEGGIGWYRKTFEFPKGCENKRFYIHFDGVFRESTVYFNEYFVGKHSSGYTGFFYDVTDFINYDKPNVLAVRVDATGHEGWWYEGGGIYRHVWLEIVEPVHVVPWGTFVNAVPDLETGNAKLTIKTEITNKLTNITAASVESIIIDNTGQEVIAVKDRINIKGWDETEWEQSVEIQDAMLWDLDNPYLYTLKTNIYLEDGQIDTLLTDFGIREIRFDSEKGVYLNGKRIKVYGLCHHHDHAGVGIAVPDSLFEFRLKKTKEMGANGYRCAHNPPSNELLNLCDRMGILVMDETRQTSSAPEYVEQLKSMVKRDRNHPSIYMWCVGNEEVFLQFQPEASRVVRTLYMETKKLDPSRAVTMGICFWEAGKNSQKKFDDVKDTFSVTGELDIAGFNYSPQKWEDYHQGMPHKPVVITESTSNSGTRGCYETNVHKGNFYVLDPRNHEKEIRKGAADIKGKGETMWSIYDSKEYMCGYFVWTAFDYRGEPSPMPYPSISSQFGILDYCGFRKDNFYYYQSWWTDEDVLHIFPHWNWSGREGEGINVYCYTNMEEVEFFLNGKSQGRKLMKKNWYLQWDDVIYQPGELLAVGYKNGKEVKRTVLETTGSPYSIELIPNKGEITADGQDVAVIEVRVLDKEGRLVPIADNEIHFDITGDGEFLGVGNGNPGSHESDKQPFRRVFAGLCQLLVKASDKKGNITIEARGEGLKSGGCKIAVIK